MKRIIYLLFFAFVLMTAGIYAQPVLEHTTTRSYYLDKFQLSGYKYVEVDIPMMSIRIYNTDHTLFRTITIPPQPYTVTTITYLSESLFDLDGSMEYALNMYSPPVQRLRIYNEDGTMIMERDSTFLTVQASTSIFNNYTQLFYDGTRTKMKLFFGTGGTYDYYEYYDLPGSIPCSDCSQGITTGIITNDNDIKKEDPAFFPNPASDQLKLRYKLPAGAKQAQIRITDMVGKQLKEVTVTDLFDFIYLPVDFNSGMYLYSLFVDGKLVKTEKIVLEK